MKISKLTIKNIGGIEDAVIIADKPEIVFFGEVKQGKSTILNSVRWVCGGAFPADIIRHGQTEASVQLEGTEADGAIWVIRREWYRAKDQTCKAREIIYTRNGAPVKKPVQEIQKHLNPFLLNQDYLRNMTALERSRYLTELFNVATADEDTTINEADRQASQLRIKIKMYGALDLTKVERVDVGELQEKRAGIVNTVMSKAQDAREKMREIATRHRDACAKVDAGNEAARTHNATVERGMAAQEELGGQIKELETKLSECKAKLTKTSKWLADNPLQTIVRAPQEPDVSQFQAIVNAQPDTAEVDVALQQAGAQNVKADNYEAAKKRATEKAADEKALLAQEKIAREAKSAKVKKLAEVGKESGIDGLTFIEGGFEFDGADSSMLSDSQIMRLSNALSAKYPEGFGLSMIDRGESLGKSVLTLWEEAVAREATVMVTVVGDKPADIPEQVGAYVVTEGKVTR